MSGRGPIAATARIVPPYLYEVLWQIALYGPLTSQEIADDHNRPLNVIAYWTSQAAANRMRPLQRLGIVERDSDGFWMLTKAGRVWMTTGADTEARA